MSRNTIAIIKSGVCLSFSWKDIKIPSVFSFKLWQEEVDIYKSTKKKKWFHNHFEFTAREICLKRVSNISIILQLVNGQTEF